jgi:hypothetical protein
MATSRSDSRLESPESSPQPNDTHAPLKFLTWQPLYATEKPFQIFMNIPPHIPDQRTTNLVFSDHVVPICDIRGRPPLKSIDEKGFVFRKHRTAIPVEGFLSRDTVETRYLPEVEQLLRREVDGVDRVFFFDWRVGLIFLPGFSLGAFYLGMRVTDDPNSYAKMLLKSRER